MGVKRADEAAQTWFEQKVGGANAANSAGALSILPASQATPLSFETVLALQRLDEPPTTISAPSATDIFLEEARKTPMERMREQILEQLGLSEADLAQMSPEERRATEDTIRQLIQEKFRQAMGGEDQPAETNTEAMLKTLA
ncbi:hypothetical protein U91I_02022 [alpha proteobacterium U9-1i]|nr:hypothetical protein U91I_02022 [alpha proteobacterium U9-1i]